MYLLSRYFSNNFFREGCDTPPFCRSGTRQLHAKKEAEHRAQLPFCYALRYSPLFLRCILLLARSVHSARREPAATPSQIGRRVSSPVLGMLSVGSTGADGVETAGSPGVAGMELSGSDGLDGVETGGSEESSEFTGSEGSTDGSSGEPGLAPPPGLSPPPVVVSHTRT